jgi:hypothetical protein
VRRTGASRPEFETWQTVGSVGMQGRVVGVGFDVDVDADVEDAWSEEVAVQPAEHMAMFCCKHALK